MDLQKLSSDVISKIRSTYNINSVVQCVSELVLNSLDAKSKAVAIRVNLVTFRIQVVDNGQGISKKNMKVIGIRYMTNKCYNIKDLQCNLKYYGFRGESLSSICELSKLVNITSKCINCEKTYTKSISNHVMSELIVCNNRPSYGTTITIEGFLHNLPIRKKQTKQEVELEEIKVYIQRLIILHPNISFTLRDDITGELILNSQKHKDVVHSFLSVHPEISENLDLLKISRDTVTIECLIHKELYKSRKLQYTYVNKRPIVNTSLQKYICDLLKKIDSNRRNAEKWPVFVINIKCPYADVDLLLNPSKTLIEFKNWDLVKRCIDKLIIVYLGKDNGKKPTKEVQTKKCKSQCTITNIQGAVRGKAFKRRAYDNLNNHVKSKVPKLLELGDGKEETDYSYHVNESDINENKLNNIQKDILSDKQKDKLYNVHNEYMQKEKPNVKFTDLINKISSKNEYLMRDIKTRHISSKNNNQNLKFQFLNDTENNYSIYFSDKEEHKNINKIAAKSFKKPLPVIINATKIPFHQKPNIEKNRTSEVKDISMFSKFTDDEDKGKNIIMDMFLKSTQVYSNDTQNLSDSTDSNHTILESNIFLQDNVKTNYHEQNRTMSISVKLKAKCLKKNKSRQHPTILNSNSFYDANIYHNVVCDQGVQTTFIKSNSNRMVSECVQTTLNKIDYNQRKFNYNKNKLDDVENYTVVLPNTARDTCTFQYVQRGTDNFNIFSFPETSNKCICGKSELMFNFNKNKPQIQERDILQNANISPIAKCNSPNIKNCVPSYMKCNIPNVSLLNITNTDDKSVTDSLYKEDNVRMNIWQNFVEKSYIVTPKTINIHSMNHLKSLYFPKQNFGERILKNNRKLYHSEETVSIRNKYESFPRFKSNDFLNSHLSNDFIKIKNLSDKINLQEQIESLKENTFHTFQPQFFSTQRNALFEYSEPEEVFTRDNQGTALQENILEPLHLCVTQNKNYLFKSAEASDKNIKCINQTDTDIWKQNYETFKPPYFSTLTTQVHDALKPKHISKEWFNVSNNSELKFLNNTVNKLTIEELTNGHNMKCLDESVFMATLSELEKQDTIQQDLNFQTNYYENSNPNIQQGRNEAEHYNNEWFKNTNNDGGVCYINKRTGMGILKSPQNETNMFCLHHRPEFLPKGLSPILLAKNVEVDTSMTQNSKQKLHNALIENCDELRLLKWESCIKYQDPKTFFEKIYQEKTKLFETNIPIATTVPKHLKPINVIVFQKDIFKYLQIIGQVDRKFIATIDSKEKLLIIFDQHAVHERVRLEMLQKEYIGAKLPCSVVTIFIRQLDLQLLKDNKDYLNSVGLTVNFFANCINIKEIPLCLYNKMRMEDDKTTLNKYIEILIQDIIETLKQTKGVVTTTPLVIQNIINMEACRGAIKFGDSLTNEECEKLISDLSCCDLPFQCAHGRPTLTPLIFFNSPVYKNTTITFSKLKT